MFVGEARGREGEERTGTEGEEEQTGGTKRGGMRRMGTDGGK